jgi:hypothetical protein
MSSRDQRSNHFDHVLLLMKFLSLCIVANSYPTYFHLNRRSSVFYRNDVTKLNSRHIDDNALRQPYRLGLSPYVVQKSNTTTSPLHSNETDASLNGNIQSKFELNASEPNVSYPYLLLLPDLTVNATKKRLHVPSLDEWMMQLPTQWASFILDGHNFTNTNILSTPETKARNEIKRIRDIGTPGIGAFESSEALDAMFEAVLRNESVVSSKNASQSAVELSATSQPFIKTMRSSTQPSSIFSNVELRKNASLSSTSSHKASTPKHSSSIASVSSRTKPPYPQYSQLKGKDPNDLVTVADLESILRNSEFYRRKESALSVPERDDVSPSKATQTQQSTKGGVAFPQPSVLSNRSIKWGATVSAGGMGMLLATSAAPNFWLIGALLGGIFGYETGNSLSAPPQETPVPRNVLQTLVLSTGRQLAKAFLKVSDAWQAFFFMYKTGQLSYEYYKTYAALDNRFAIQNKIDAWNARFVEGKMAFDRWERENEVGRKLLAGLRTAWLVEERSQKKRTGLLKRSQRHQSRYRIIQFLYDAAYTCGKLWSSMWSALLGGEIGAEIQAFFRGLLRGDANSLSTAQARVRGIVLTVVAVYLTGALFTISPGILAIFAAGLGWIWPTWTSEIVERTGNFFDETRARGKGESISSYSTKRSNAMLAKSNARFDKSRYHFYRTADGNKRYYRVGQPWFLAELFQKKPPPKPKGIFSWISRSG